MSTTWKPDPEDPAFELGWEGATRTGERRRVSGPVTGIEPTLPAAPVSTAKITLPRWTIAAMSFGAVLILGGTVGGVILLTQSLTQPRDAALAQDECVQTAQEQLKSPSTASLVDARTFGPLTEEYDMEELTDYFTPFMVQSQSDSVLDTLSNYFEVLAEAGNGEKGDNPRPGGYVVGGVFDAENSFGATTRAHFICATHVVGTEITDTTKVSFF